MCIKVFEPYKRKESAINNNGSGDATSEACLGIVSGEDNTGRINEAHKVLGQVASCIETVNVVEGENRTVSIWRVINEVTQWSDEQPL